MRNIISLAVVVFLVSVPSISAAWTGPSATAPNSNASAPINVGAVDQVKSASLGVNGIAVFGNSLLGGAVGSNAYLNFGPTAGSGGYGIRDNAGLLEFKNTGGSWQTLQSVIAGLGGGDNLGNHAATQYLQMGAQWINLGTGGIYTASFGNHFWAPNASYWYMRSNNGMLLQNIAGTNLGYLYSDGGANFGLLSPAGGWRVRVSNSDTELYATAYAGDFRPSIIYDRDNTGYYVDPNGSSYTNYFGRNYGYNWTEYDWNNTAYYIDPNNASIFNDIRANVFYDYSNTGYYMVPRSTSRMNYTIFDNVYSYSWMQAPYFLDANDNGYYLDLNQVSRTNSIVSNAFWYASDRRLKDNVVPIDSALAKLMQISGVTFDWNEKAQGRSGHDVGVIAQDVEAVYPEAVVTLADGYKAVDYPKLVPLLIEAIKEQNARINALQSKQGEVDALKKRIEILEAIVHSSL